MGIEYIVTDGIDRRYNTGKLEVIRPLECGGYDENRQPETMAHGRVGEEGLFHYDENGEYNGDGTYLGGCRNYKNGRCKLTPGTFLGFGLLPCYRQVTSMNEYQKQVDEIRGRGKKG